MKFNVFLTISFTVITLSALGQDFTRYDSLRGSLHSMRAYDVSFYDLHLRVNPERRSISGYNKIYFKSTDTLIRMQVDLFANMNVDSILSAKTIYSFERDSNFIFINFKQALTEGEENILTIYYSGQPQVAAKPPWDGGFVWSTDSLGRPWIGVAVEGVGASLWWPNKDHISEKPDSMRMSFEVPSQLTCVANGRLREKKDLQDGYTRFVWFVNNPINNYNVTLNIAHYAFFDDLYPGKSGNLDLHYHVLDYNLSKAKKHFRQVRTLMDSFEKLFGPYPFYEDSYKLVETPYWGMEHQSCIAYGNNYKTDYFDFDYIILHESGHEWFGNRVTAADHGELWIHEAFTTYSEALYIENRFGYKNMMKYLHHQKSLIMNNEPILGPLGVNYHHWAGADMYYKGAWMLHTIRRVLDNDALWFDIMRGIPTDLGGTIVNTQEIIAYFNKKSGQDLGPVFMHYLTKTDPPKLIYSMEKKKNKTFLRFRWETEDKDFNMPVDILVNKKEKIRIHPSSKTKRREIPVKKIKSVEVDDGFYINVN
ncbi:MAG: M1 family metallopeptidase [Cytophagaceae bacterium]